MTLLLQKATEAALINARHSNCECFGLCDQYEQTKTCAACCYGMESLSVATEEANYSRKNKYPVFIVLMHTSTSLAHAIKAVTRDEFSHAAIAFDPSLKPLYSFGLGSRGDEDHLGMILNSYDDGGKYVEDAYYSVYVMYVNKKTYTEMQKTLQTFMDKLDDWKFDFVNLVGCGLHIPSEKSKKYFCSRFVATIINSGRHLEKKPSLYKPSDFTELDDISLVNHGLKFKEYNENITKRNMNLVKRSDFSSIAFENAVWTKEFCYPVYFVLMHYNTPMMHAISAITNAQFSHVCISFDSSLIPMYSFGKKDTPGILKMGLTDMNPKSEFIKNNKTYYSVYVTFVNKETITKMKAALQSFIDRDRENPMKYDFGSLPKVFLQKKQVHKNKHFCSEFCAEILHAGKTLGKDTSLYLPEDFCNMDDATLVNHGTDFSKYDKSVTERNINLIKDKKYAQIDFDYANEASNRDKYFFRKTNL